MGQGGGGVNSIGTMSLNLQVFFFDGIPYSAEVQELLFKPSSKIFKGVKPVLSEYPDTCGVCCQYRVTRSPRLPINCTHSGKLISLVRDWNSLTNTLNCFPELTSVSPEQTKFWRCSMCFSGHLIVVSYCFFHSLQSLSL